MLKQVLIFIFSFSFITNFAQEKANPVKIINKEIPEIIENQIKEALKYYPELAETHIDFKFKDNIKNAFMVAQPKWYGVFQGKTKRAYTIKMKRNFQLKDASVPIEKIPSEVVIGWIAHELGHIMDYEKRSGIALLGFGVSYITSTRFLIRAEQTADVHAIDHGLGNYIINTKHYILDHEGISKKYKKKIRTYYMSPEMVVQYIEESDYDYDYEEDTEI